MDSRSTKEVMLDQIVQVPQVHFATIQLSTGIDMHYAEYGDPARKPIVFLHGFTDSWFSFSPVLKYLPPNYHVLMLDHRGHGNSSKPETGYEIGDFAADTIAFMSALELQNVTLIGHSLGSFIAQRVAVTTPELIARLILIGSSNDPRTDDLMPFLDAVNALEDPVPEEFARGFQVSTIYGNLSDEFMRQVVSESMKLPARVWHQTLNELLSEKGITPFAQIQMPTLILWGEQDTTWLRAAQEILAAGIPQAELVIYEETGHALHWEQPERFARELEDFMAVRG